MVIIPNIVPDEPPLKENPLFLYEERLKWLAGMSKSPMTPEKYKNLVKWYGPVKASRVEVTESFEICEYRKQPSDQEIRRLFPMLGN
jgi:hypothetical protein